MGCASSQKDGPAKSAANGTRSNQHRQSNEAPVHEYSSDGDSGRRASEDASTFSKDASRPRRQDSSQVHRNSKEKTSKEKISEQKERSSAQKSSKSPKSPRHRSQADSDPSRDEVLKMCSAKAKESQEMLNAQWSHVDNQLDNQIATWLGKGVKLTELDVALVVSAVQSRDAWLALSKLQDVAGTDPSVSPICGSMASLCIAEERYLVRRELESAVTRADTDDLELWIEEASGLGMDTSLEKSYCTSLRQMLQNLAGPSPGLSDSVFNTNRSTYSDGVFDTSNSAFDTNRSTATSTTRTGGISEDDVHFTFSGPTGGTMNDEDLWTSLGSLGGSGKASEEEELLWVQLSSALEADDLLTGLDMINRLESIGGLDRPAASMLRAELQLARSPPSSPRQSQSRTSWQNRTPAFVPPSAPSRPEERRWEPRRGGGDEPGAGTWSTGGQWRHGRNSQGERRSSKETYREDSASRASAGERRPYVVPAAAESQNKRYRYASEESQRPAAPRSQMPSSGPMGSHEAKARVREALWKRRVNLQTAARMHNDQGAKAKNTSNERRRPSSPRRPTSPRQSSAEPAFRSSSRQNKGRSATEQPDEDWCASGLGFFGAEGMGKMGRDASPSRPKRSSSDARPTSPRSRNVGSPGHEKESEIPSRKRPADGGSDGVGSGRPRVHIPQTKAQGSPPSKERTGSKENTKPAEPSKERSGSKENTKPTSPRAGGKENRSGSKEDTKQTSPGAGGKENTKPTSPRGGTAAKDASARAKAAGRNSSRPEGANSSGGNSGNSQTTPPKSAPPPRDEAPPPRTTPKPGATGGALEVLGLSPGFTDEDLRSAYKKAVMKWHPDRPAWRNCSDEEVQKATDMFRKVKDAYDLLSKGKSGGSK